MALHRAYVTPAAPLQPQVGDKTYLEFYMRLPSGVDYNGTFGVIWLRDDAAQNHYEAEVVPSRNPSGFGWDFAVTLRPVVAGAPDTSYEQTLTLNQDLPGDGIYRLIIEYLPNETYKVSIELVSFIPHTFLFQDALDGSGNLNGHAADTGQIWTDVSGAQPLELSGTGEAQATANTATLYFGTVDTGGPLFAANDNEVFFELEVQEYPTGNLSQRRALYFCSDNPATFASATDYLNNAGYYALVVEDGFDPSPGDFRLVTIKLTKRISSSSAATLQAGPFLLPSNKVYRFGVTLHSATDMEGWYEEAIPNPTRTSLFRGDVSVGQPHLTGTFLSLHIEPLATPWDRTKAASVREIGLYTPPPSGNPVGTYLLGNWSGAPGFPLTNLGFLSPLGTGLGVLAADNLGLADFVIRELSYSPTTPPRGPSVKYTEVFLAGAPRAAHAWRDDDGKAWLAVGTTTDAYRYRDGVAYSLQPWRASTPTATKWEDTPFGAPRVDGTQLTGGFGAGAYGRGRYGRGTGGLTIVPPDTWSLDTISDQALGTRLVGCYTLSEELYYEDAGVFKLVPNAPSARAIVATPEHFLFALASTNNGRFVQWSDQGDITTWAPASTNQAGGAFLVTRGRLLAGKRTRRQTLLWTDIDVHAAIYVGGPFVYNFEQLGDNCGAISPHSMAVFGDVAIWMSHNKFFIYDGAVRPLDCEVLDYVFGNLNRQQAGKIFAVPLAQFNSVIWFYPAAVRQANEPATTECTRYVEYNYKDRVWSFGLLDRGAGVDRGVFEFPVFVGLDARLYEHEKPGAPKLRFGQQAVPFIESGPVEGPDGRLLRVQRLVPDERTMGEADFFLWAGGWPNQPEKRVGPLPVSRPASARTLGRVFRLRIQERVPNSDWRVGDVRLGVRLEGKR